MNVSLNKYLIKDQTKINPNIRKLIEKYKDRDLFESLARKYNLPSLDNLTTLQLAQIFWYEKHGHINGKCLTCEKPTKFTSLNLGWLKFCNASCQMKHPSQQELRVKDSLERFNCKSYLQKENKLKEIRTTDEFKTKHRIGVINSWKNNKDSRVASMLLSRKQSNNKYWANRFRDKLDKLKELNFSIISSYNNGRPNIIEHSCGQQQPYGRWANDTYLCIACSPNPRIKSESSMLDEIEQLIGRHILRNVKFDNIKVDGLIEGCDIAIDYNGLFWHSSAAEAAGFGKYNSEYHIARRKILQKHGIKLIQVFEDEWLHKKEIVINRICHSTGMSSKIMARKCKIRTLDKNEARNFIIRNHLTGNVPFKYAIGLTFEDHLVAVATFGKSRYSNKEYLELLRFCSDGQIIGGLSRLVNHAIKTFDTSVLSYSDNLWGDGDAYRSAGFVLDGDVGAGYFYFDKKNFSRVARQAFTKANFERTFNVKYDETISERDNAAKVNCFIVHDAGKKRWIKHK